MKNSTIGVSRFATGALLLAIGAGGGWWWARYIATPPTTEHPKQHSTAQPEERKVLYWYDPMVPDQHFDKPGKSPFMDMQLLPKFAESRDGGMGVQVDAATQQNLGMRLEPVVREALVTSIDVTGMIGFNDRDVAVLQARTAGFVERAWPMAIGDVVTVGQPLVQLRVPEWTAGQFELLALREQSDTTLLAMARERLQSLGMPTELIRAVEASGVPQPLYTVTAPISGMVAELDVRSGMSVEPGRSLIRINGLDTVWLEVAVPEASAGSFKQGDAALVRLASTSEAAFEGRIATVLPALDTASRSVRVRVELPNMDRRLRPGMSAQVTLQGRAQGDALTVPTEAVIRTGRRALVMLADKDNRFTPTEVILGQEIGLRTVIAAGLAEGQQVVASGQFLIDSEARIAGMEPNAPAAAVPSEHPHGNGAPAVETQRSYDLKPGGNADMQMDPNMEMGQGDSGTSHMTHGTAGGEK